MENKFVKLIENNNWSDYTFILTSVCVGNVGQLATDLLISSLPNTQKAGYLISSLVQPIVGYNTNRFELSLSVELYENKPLKLVIMQQRAPIFKGKQADFAELLVDFIKREGFKEVICLTSSHAYERLDSQIMGTQTRFLSTNDEIKKSLEANLKWKGLEKRTSTESKPLGYFIPGGGISQKFFKKCEEQKLNVVVLIIFAHEGNNIPESIQLVNYLNEWKEFLPKSQLKGEKEGSALKEPKKPKKPKEPKKQRVVDENRLDWKYTEKERYQRLFGSMSKLAVSKQ